MPVVHDSHRFNFLKDRQAVRNRKEGGTKAQRVMETEHKQEIQVMQRLNKCKIIMCNNNKKIIQGKD